MRLFRTNLALFLAAATVCTADASDIQMTYFTGLGTLGGTYSVATGINASGQIVGQASTADGQYDAFLYTSGTGMTALAAPGATYGEALAINNAGQVVGDQFVGSADDALLYTPGVGFTDLGPLGTGSDSQAYAINSLGQIAGTSYALHPPGPNGFLYTPGSGVVNLGNLGGTSPNGYPLSDAYGINDSGTVVGVTTTPGGDEGFVYSGGVMTPLGAGTWARAINTAGQIAGQSGNSAAIFYGSSTTDLAFPSDACSSPYGWANALNNVGEAVGASCTGASDNESAVLYYNGTAIDLNTLLPTDSGWQLTVAIGINDSGQIVGFGLDPAGDQEAFLLDTSMQSSGTPEPSTWALVALGALALGCVRATRAIFGER
jgi:probable HAF family extracellular repeat protein